ncbi:CopG family transcriptional regulator [Mesorhizobium loti]|uniref:CopG family transcriptional regulator n=1 Tax=Rhizobium loti TaxID=381 RepID=A0A101KWF0_RHILI|nr:CopG family transcriptional regulator [Mesorhizobium loti]
MKITVRLAALAVLTAFPMPVLAAPIQAVMYKNPSCSCCETYAAYLEKNGFKVDIKPTNDLAQVSAGLGVPPKLQGCHSVVIGDYVVDGFVPVDVINKMLTERPAVTGIALAGMPMGSPGMGGEKTERFAIYSFTKDGKPPAVYATE